MLDPFLAIFQVGFIVPRFFNPGKIKLVVRISKMDMEMRAGEDIEISRDLTHRPLPPLAHALHPTFLSTHCSSCFSPLLPTRCSPLRLSSDESSLPADLRAALCLLRTLPLPLPDKVRISGLSTNYAKLMDDEDTAAHVLQGVRDMVSAVRLRNVTGMEELEEAAACCLCLVMTNAVEVVDGEGRALGIAVFGPEFSWINHSCSPNACYRFVLSPPPPPAVEETQPQQWIAPASRNGENSVANCTGLGEGCCGYGPRVMVRSIKEIRKGEEVTVAYTDLFLPKALRQSELRSKYCFSCCCERCNASPPGYVDRVLEEIFISKGLCSRLSSDNSFDRDAASRKLTDYIDEVTAEYLTVSNAESCCEKLESMLIFGLLDKQFVTREGESQLTYHLHPLNHLALDAYATLASAYKIRASDLSVVCSEGDKHHFQVFDMSRISVAYSLLLAVASYHLFCFEASLIASVANYWTSAGESLLALARSSAWRFFRESGLQVPELPSEDEYKCPKCSLLQEPNAHFSLSPGENVNFGYTSSSFLHCITVLPQKVWSSLIQGCGYLKMLDNFDFSWLGKCSNMWDLKTHLASQQADSHRSSEGSVSRLGPHFYSDLERESIFQLGIHCLSFGGFLGTVCYGQGSDWINRIRRGAHIQGL